MNEAVWLLTEDPFRTSTSVYEAAGIGKASYLGYENDFGAQNCTDNKLENYINSMKEPILRSENTRDMTSKKNQSRFSIKKFLPNQFL